MNDYEAARLMLRPVEDHPAVVQLLAQADEAKVLDCEALLAAGKRFPMSSGEMAILTIASAVYRWRPIPFECFGALSKGWCHHVLAVLIRRFDLDEFNAEATNGLLHVGSTYEY